MNDNEGNTHTITINTVLSELEVSAYSLEKLITEGYEHEITPANENA